MEPIRISFLAACPSDRPRHKVEEEFKNIEEELYRSDLRDRFDCRFVPAVGRRDLLWQLLKLKPHLIHFSGHGSEDDELILESPSGTSEPLSAEELERVFTLIPAEDRPKVVVLSACYSQVQAEAITRVIDCAVGMSQQIRDSAALAFAQGFYLAIGRGLAVDDALEAGRLAMPGSAESRELPRLHVREGAQLTTKHLVGAGPVSRFPDELHIDRAAQLERFRAMLQTGEPRVLVVTAQGNMGKTRLMEAMARLAAGHPVGLTDLTKSAGTSEIVLRRLASGLGIATSDEHVVAPAGAAGATPESVQADPKSVAARRAEVAGLTRQLIADAEATAEANGPRAAILLDGFDEASGEIATWVQETLLPNVLRSGRIVCVVAGRVEPTVETALHLVGKERLENFGENDVREVFELLRLDASARVVRTAWIATKNGNPFLTVQTLKELWRDAVGSRAAS